MICCTRRPLPPERDVLAEVSMKIKGQIMKQFDRVTHFLSRNSSHKKEVKVRRVQMNGASASTRLQAASRGRTARRKLSHQRSAAIKVQAAVRGHRARTPEHLVL
mmetsp:Transcript_45937/g.113984  ORF Transcript_45937/g.113984 Transcript_45937/m.113984 type:complete len:105 (+) Transcript_45937:93-407(+)